MWLFGLQLEESFACGPVVSFCLECGEGSAMMRAGRTLGQVGTDCCSSEDDLRGIVRGTVRGPLGFEIVLEEKDQKKCMSRTR